MNTETRPREVLLQDLRGRCRGKVRPSGIYLVYRSRTQDAAKGVASLVRELGGEASLGKSGKVRLVNGQSNAPARCEFTISCPLDAYIGGTMNLREALVWEAKQHAN